MTDDAEGYTWDIRRTQEGQATANHRSPKREWSIYQVPFGSATKRMELVELIKLCVGKANFYSRIEVPDRLMENFVLRAVTLGGVNKWSIFRVLPMRW